MSSRWAMLGSQVGGGIGSALNQYMQPRIQMQNARNLAKSMGYNLSDAGREMLLKQAVFGSKGDTSTDDLLKMAMLGQIFPGMAGALKGVVPIGNIFEKIGENKPTQSGSAPKSTKLDGVEYTIGNTEQNLKNAFQTYGKDNLYNAFKAVSSRGSTMAIPIGGGAPLEFKKGEVIDPNKYQVIVDLDFEGM